jgi:hypothetical protein
VPQVEVLELDLRAGLEVAGQQGEMKVVARRQRVEQRADAGHDPLAGPRLVELLGEVMNVAVGETRELGRIRANAVRGCSVGQNAGIGAAGHRHVAKRITDREQLVEGEGHRPYSSAAAEHKRTVDVEKDQFGRDRLELPFAAHVPGARSFRRRLLVEVHALAFVQLIEAALHGTSVEKPLLPAVVANESKSPIPNESLDSAGRHPSLLGRARLPKEWTVSIFIPRSDELKDRFTPSS